MKTTRQGPSLEGRPPSQFSLEADHEAQYAGTVSPGSSATAILHQRRRRTQIEIIVDILEAASMGATKTALVYKSNLNFTLIDRYVVLLESKGLLQVIPVPERPGVVLFKTSDKGTEALLALRHAVSLAFEEITPGS